MINDDYENLIVLSGGGAVFGYSYGVLCGLADRGINPAMLGTTSTGTVGAFLFSKGLIQQGHDLCDLAYAQNARQITKPGIASIKNGRLKINWLKALSQLTFNRNKIVSLMDNQPLIDTLTELDRQTPGFPIQIFYNEVDMITGKLVEHSTADTLPSGTDRIRSMVASTSIPVVWPLIDGRFGDAGIREGTPLSAMFDRKKPGKKYRIIVISCNQQNLVDCTDLSRIDKIAARTVAISLNETLVNDLGRTQDRNEVAKAVALHRQRIDAVIDKFYVNTISPVRDALTLLSQQLWEDLPYTHAPIYILEYDGPSTTFSFTPQDLKEQRARAKAHVEKFVASLESGEA